MLKDIANAALGPVVPYVLLKTPFDEMERFVYSLIRSNSYDDLHSAAFVARHEKLMASHLRYKAIFENVMQLTTDRLQKSGPWGQDSHGWDFILGTLKSASKEVLALNYLATFYVSHAECLPEPI